MEKSVKSQSFIKGIIILFFSQIVIKLLGFIYRVVITGMEGFGDIGNSYFGAAFQVYTVILAISTVGIPSGKPASQVILVLSVKKTFLYGLVEICL